MTTPRASLRFVHFTFSVSLYKAMVTFGHAATIRVHQAKNKCASDKKLLTKQRPRSQQLVKTVQGGTCYLPFTSEISMAVLELCTENQYLRSTGTIYCFQSYISTRVRSCEEPERAHGHDYTTIPSGSLKNHIYNISAFA